MAKRVQVLMVDDVDKTSPADETVSFSLDGVNYEIDLTSANAASLRDALAPWVGHAERVGGRKSTSKAGRSNSEEVAKIREWARANGHTVSDRGRISSELREAYAAAH